MLHPALVLFREVKRGDVWKALAVSNVATSGGGARDLRLPKEYVAFIQPMFPSPGPEAGVSTGTIRWKLADGRIEQGEFELWRPTESRPTEARIAQIRRIPRWQIPIDAFDRADALGRKMFYTLAMDTSGQVWAEILNEERFDEEDPGLVKYIRERLADTRKDRAALGVVDFQRNSRYPP